jgi:hypothetical protein
VSKSLENACGELQMEELRKSGTQLRSTTATASFTGQEERHSNLRKSGTQLLSTTATASFTGQEELHGN